MQLRAGLAVFNRPDGIQIGSYPHAVLFNNLSVREHELLVFLRRHLPSTRVREKARVLGISAARVKELELMLDEVGVLAPGYERSRPRGLSVHITVGKARDSLQIHRILGYLKPLVHYLARSGADIAVDYRGSDLGADAPQKLNALLDYPLAEASTPTIGIIVCARSPSVAMAAEYFSAHIPYLSVVATETTVEIGPLTRLGTSPCLNCVDLHYRDADPHFKTVRQQLNEQPFPVLPEALLATAAYATGTIVTDSGSSGGLLSGEVRVITTDLLTERLRFPAHPNCACNVTPVQWLDGQSLIAESRIAPV